MSRSQIRTEELQHGPEGVIPQDLNCKSLVLRKPADIQEIEILGVPPDGTSLALVTPPIDLARSVHETEHAKPTQRNTQEFDKPGPY